MESSSALPVGSSAAEEPEHSTAYSSQIAVEISLQNANSNRIIPAEYAMEIEPVNLPPSMRASFAKRSVSISDAATFIDRIPSRIRRHITFYRLHLLYFIILGLVGTFIFWIAPPKVSIPVSFLDAMFNVVSAMTVTGLTTVKTGHYHTFDAVLFMIIIVLGSQVFTSLLPLHIRRYQFYKNAKQYGFFKENNNPVFHNPAPGTVAIIQEEEEGTNNQVVNELKVSPLPDPRRNAKTASEGAPWKVRIMKKFRAFKDFFLGNDDDCETAAAVMVENLQPWELVYIEYRALLQLSRLVIAYLVLVHLVGFILVEVCIQASPASLRVLKEHNLNHALFSIFATVSLFAGAGFALLDENMVPFVKNSGLLLWLVVLILLGNTMYAPCLRGIIILLHKYSKGKTKLAYEYLLLNPRKCFTHLFPCRQTWWLVTTVMAFNTTEVFFFIVLDWKSDALKGLQSLHKIVAGIYQSANTRHAGTNVVALGLLSPAMLVLYIIMMYIAIYPVYLSRENTRVNNQDMRLFKNRHADYEGYNKIAVQSRRLIARDSAYVFIAMFILCIVEDKRITKDPLNFSTFNILFELISGYGNNGLSIGYSCSLLKTGEPCEDVPYSLAGKFNKLGKLIVIFVMMLGRHRGLPENIDAAVTLPAKSVSYASMPTISRLASYASMPAISRFASHASMPSMADIVPGSVQRDTERAEAVHDEKQ